MAMTSRFAPWLLLLFTFAGTQAWATPGTGSTQVDEPAALALLVLGVSGLAIGRYLARPRD